MNLQHLKNITEVERAGSVTKAAANLFMGQPNLSKSIKEVENEIGITVFRRSAKGVYPTPEGARFLTRARAVLEEMDKLEALYKQGKAAAEADENFVFDAVTAMNDYIVSNCSVSQIDELFEQMTTYEFVGIETIAGDVVKGEKYMEFHFDPDELKKLVVECFYLPQNKD